MNSAGVSMIFFVRDSERLDIFIMKFPISLFRAARLFTTVITGTARLMSGWARELTRSACSQMAGRCVRGMNRGSLTALPRHIHIAQRRSQPKMSGWRN